MKQTRHENHRIQINASLPFPVNNPDREHQLLLEGMRGLQEIINRFLNEHTLLPRFTSEICSDTREICSHCEQTWEVLTEEDIAADPQLLTAPGDGPGIPQCCAKAQAQWRAEHGRTCLQTLRPATAETPEERCEQLAEPHSDYCAPHREANAKLEALADAAEFDGHLDQGLRWLYATEQPDTAIVPHQGISVRTARNRSLRFHPKGHDGGPVIVLYVTEEKFQGEGAGQTPANPLDKGELAALVDQLTAWGHPVLSTWNGEGFSGSVSLEKPAHPSLLAALQRHRDGCPEHPRDRSTTLYCICEARLAARRALINPFTELSPEPTA